MFSIQKEITRAHSICLISVQDPSKMYQYFFIRMIIKRRLAKFMTMLISSNQSSFQSTVLEGNQNSVEKKKNKIRKLDSTYLIIA